MTPPPAALRIRNLRKSWRRGTGHSTTLFDDAALTVPAGEAVALLGPSGAGKSSLLHLCAGLDDRYGGSITVLGHALEKLGSAALARLRRRQLGFASQQGGLVGNLSVLDNVTMALWLDGQAPKIPYARQLLELLDIAHLAQSAPRDLSGGEVARVALARALYGRPRLLLCDEPTHALDVDRRQRVTGALLDAAADGTALLVATHDADLAAAMGRCITIRGGRLTEEGTS
jgi:putative ABC transport system ATP-binding protein